MPKAESALLCPKRPDSGLHNFEDGTRCYYCNAPRPAWPDWTIDPATNRSNSSSVFEALCQEVERLIRSAAHQLIAGRADVTAGLIMAQLAHKWGLVPRELIESEAAAKLKELEGFAEAHGSVEGYEKGVLYPRVVLDIIRRKS